MLIVDDDKGIHEVTKLVLDDLTFGNRPIQFLSSYSSAEAMEILRTRNDIAVLILDVVMESEDAGLRLVEYLRNDLENSKTRIILRTGQPGHAPERQVITKYDINDYKEKTELTSSKLYATVVSALRSFRDIQALHDGQARLKMLVSATSDLLRVHDFKSLYSSVLKQLSSLVEYRTRGCSQEICGFAAAETGGRLEIFEATGSLERLSWPVGGLLARFPSLETGLCCLESNWTSSRRLFLCGFNPRT